MSKPKHYWYGSVRKMIMSASEVEKEKTLQAVIFNHALEDAFEETRKLPNGDKRIKAVEDILIHKTKTYDGVAMDMFYDKRTIQSWVNSFVNLVGKKAGY